MLALIGIVGACGSSAASTDGSRCATRDLVLNAGAQGEATGVAIYARVSTRRGSCVVDRAIDLTIESRGRAARISGNPAPVGIHQRINRTSGDAVVFEWQNWCGSRNALRGVVRFGSLARHVTFPVLPHCVQRKSGSSLGGTALR